MLQLLVFLAILSVLVLVHEWGHYITAKIFGIRVEEFGFGIPPRAKVLFERKGTLFTLNYLPLGGFVRLFGEEYTEDDALSPKQSGRFYDKPIWQRAVVLTAGVVMNFVLATFVFAIVYSVMGIPTKVDKVIVSEVRSGSPAEEVGLKEGEKIETIDGKLVKKTDEFVSMINENKGKEVVLDVIASDGSKRMVKVTPRENPPEGEGAMGVVLSNIEMKKYPVWEMPFRGVLVGFDEAVAWGKDIASGLFTMISGLLTGKGVPKDLAGPVGIYEVTGKVTAMGILPTLQFLGVFSVNLAILNLMPFPGLDGGRVVFLGIEKIIGKRRKNKIEGYVHTVGFYLLLAFMVFVTARDILRIVTKSGI